MADIVNLRRRRKQKRRAAEAEATIEKGRAAARPAGDTVVRGREKALSDRRLDGHRRERPESD